MRVWVSWGIRVNSCLMVEIWCVFVYCVFYCRQYLCLVGIEDVCDVFFIGWMVGQVMCCWIVFVFVYVFQFFEYQCQFLVWQVIGFEYGDGVIIGFVFDIV